MDQPVTVMAGHIVVRTVSSVADADELRRNIRDTWPRTDKVMCDDGWHTVGELRDLMT